jgi:cobalamin-dependent methionine synthase I
LHLLKQAVDRGHPISKVAQMSDAKLKRLLKQVTPRLSGIEYLSGKLDAHSAKGALDSSKAVESALKCIMQLDVPGLEKVLNHASVNMSRFALLQLIILPLFSKIGDLWRAGRLKIVHENLATVVVRPILWDMLRSIRPTQSAARIVVATPVGHWHEFGALASGLAALESGWRVSYFGPNLPMEEIAFAVKRLDAKALALSFGHVSTGSQSVGALGKLRRLVGKSLPIFIGGAGVDLLRQRVEALDIFIGNDLRRFRDRLEGLAKIK